MSEPIRKVAVIGAGVMGAGIAAHVANAGIPVLLLDLTAEMAAGAVQKMLKADPAPFMSRAAAKLVSTNSIDAGLDQLAECDWIVEAVVERLDVKQDLYRKIAAVKKAGAVVSSNTSTIPLATLMEGLPGDFAADFVITHFFNPPRYMRLLEVVAGAATKPATVARISDFGDRLLGKTVVHCKDTPGFIGNRIGVYWLQAAVSHALDEGVSVEEADAVIGKTFGIPKTGVFGLLDLVGLDLMPHVISSMAGALPSSDPIHAVVRDVPVLRQMIADGYIGRKGKGGFYRLNRAGGGKVKEAIDLQTGQYRKSVKAALDSLGAAKAGGMRALFGFDDRGGRYAWKVMGGTLAYAASLVPEIADDIVAVDEAMKLGYAWKYGPFELIDKVGAAWFAAQLKERGLAVPKLVEQVGEGSFYRIENGTLQYFGTDGAYHDMVRPEGVLLLADVKRRSKPLAKNGSASLWDIGDGVVCLEFHSKMNSIDPEIMALIRKAIGLVPAKGFKAMVVYNEGSNFSVGANIGLALFAANIGLWSELENMVEEGQNTYKALRYAPFPVVGAPSGLALGGGCEIVLHCDAVTAHAETYIGLVETGVGLVPAWGGCKEMLRRWSANPALPRGPMPRVAKVFEIVSMATVAKSAAEAKEHGFFTAEDGIVMNRDRLLAAAKAKALELAEGYQPPAEPEFQLPGESAKVAMEMAVQGFRKIGKATPHDEVVARHLADVLAGGNTDVTELLTEDQVLALERKNFMALTKTSATLARVEHMLETGKPLRN